MDRNVGLFVDESNYHEGEVERVVTKLLSLGSSDALYIIFLPRDSNSVRLPTYPRRNTITESDYTICELPQEFEKIHKKLARELLPFFPGKRGHLKKISIVTYLSGDALNVLERASSAPDLDLKLLVVTNAGRELSRAGENHPQEFLVNHASCPVLFVK